MSPHRLPSFVPDSDGEKVPSTPKFVHTRSTATLPRSRTLSSFALRQTREPAFLIAVKHPRIFASLLAHLSWRACWALLNTCSGCRDFFSCPELKDVILSRFVPGYSACVRISDPLRLQTVPVALADLNLLSKPDPYLSFLKNFVPTFLGSDFSDSRIAPLSNACLDMHLRTFTRRPPGGTRTDVEIGDPDPSSFPIRPFASGSCTQLNSSATS
jgi:hypothetical protein